MAKAKWRTGLLGWVIFGPVGGLLGYFLGATLDGLLSDETGPVGGTSSAGMHRVYSPLERRNSFLISLLVLAAAVIKADGKTLDSEKAAVRTFIRNNFGEAAVGEAMGILEELLRKDVNIYSVGPQIAANMNYSERLQLFHFLVGIAVADNDFSKSEKGVLEAIGSVTGLNPSDISSIIAMYWKENDSAYRILGISPDATVDEIKTAYRRMAMKYHPDKVATLGEDVRKAAETKFRSIQEAYESIKKQRGF